MKKLILIFCCFSLLSLGTLFNFGIDYPDTVNEKQLGFVITNMYASAEDGNGNCTCYLTDGGSVDRVRCNGCLSNGAAYGTKGTCSC